MNKTLFLIVIVLLIAYVTPALPPAIEYPSYVDEDGVYWGGQLPQFGKVCTETPVYGGPDASIFPTFGNLSVGMVVPLHELSRPDGSWVMIEKARWIPLGTICR